MDKIIYIDGIEYLTWNDSKGDTWTARYDEVQLFGKECFEQMPGPDDLTGEWSVEFNDPDTNGLLPEPTDEDYEYADEFFNF